MINLVKTPQRAEIKAEYTINEDVLIIKIGEIEEVFDFTGLAEGQAEEIIAEILPINPIVNVEKIGTEINITTIYFYDVEEKELFENVTN